MNSHYTLSQPYLIPLSWELFEVSRIRCTVIEIYTKLTWLMYVPAHAVDKSLAE